MKFARSRCVRGLSWKRCKIVTIRPSKNRMSSIALVVIFISLVTWLTWQDWWKFYVANIFVTLLNHTTKFKEVKIRVSRIGFKRKVGETAWNTGAPVKYGRSGSPTRDKGLCQPQLTSTPINLPSSSSRRLECVLPPPPSYVRHEGLQRWPWMASKSHFIYFTVIVSKSTSRPVLHVI